jgi:hypothetical protein
MRVDVVRTSLSAEARSAGRTSDARIGTPPMKQDSRASDCACTLFTRIAHSARPNGRGAQLRAARAARCHYVETVTRMNVAGIEVLPSPPLF